MKKKRKTKNAAGITVRSERIEFLKINAARREWRDTYHWILSLSWPRFAAFLLAVYLTLNLIFATAYAVGGPCIGEMTPGSFPEAFFFSVETLATVGYGHMFPATAYGHVVTTIELIVAMVWVAVITGLIFVRFSRPTARILFSDAILIGNFNGSPHLMVRVANLRHTSMVDARFRVVFSRDEKMIEGEIVRRFYELPVNPASMISFPAALTLRHTIDERSPLYGQTAEAFQKAEAFFLVSTSSIETVMAASVQSSYGYSWSEIRFGERFVDVYEELEDGRLKVDYGRLHETEPVPHHHS